MQYTPRKMKYIKPVQDVIDTINSTTDGVDIVPTFPEGPASELSCIVHAPGSDRFGLIGVDIDGYGQGINCFVFNGKLYNYCKAEGFSQKQMVEDQSFENKVLTEVSVDELVEYIASN